MLAVNYLKMKKTLLKNFKNQQVVVAIEGTLNTKLYIDNAKILINKDKLIIFNDNTDCIILFEFIQKIIIDNDFKIELSTKNEKYILEV